VPLNFFPKRSSKASGSKFVGAAAAFTIAAVALTFVGSGAQPVPGWTLHYGFGTGICGGTSFDAYADGRFRLVTNYCSGPRGESTGALSTDALRRLQLAVQSTNPDTWATSYESRCVEHLASLSLTRADRGRAPTTVHVQWGCGLTGVPSDARALIVAVRTVAADVFPGVHLDTTPSLESVAVARHEALTIVAANESAPRTLELGADGSFVRRSRVSAALYPVADCPARELEPADQRALVRLHALETPSAVVSPATSSDTQALFSRVMRDCPAIEGGYTSPEVRVPGDVRWIVFYVRSPTRRPTTEPTRSIWVDSSGRFRAQLEKVPILGTFDGAVVRGLDRALAAAPKTSLATSYPFDSTDCLASLYVIRVDRLGARHPSQPADIACDASAVPPDARDIAAAVGALLSRAIP